jgi:hypothetical protein
MVSYWLALTRISTRTGWSGYLTYVKDCLLLPLFLFDRLCRYESGTTNAKGSLCWTRWGFRNRRFSRGSAALWIVKGEADEARKKDGDGEVRCAFVLPRSFTHRINSLARMMIITVYEAMGEQYITGNPWTHWTCIVCRLTILHSRITPHHCISWDAIVATVKC